MCGICGIVAPRGQTVGVTRQTLETMRDRLTHRGPDDAGLLWGETEGDPGIALGHRRLSILDPTPAGHQPMTTPDGRHTLVYNGELYNDKEIRDRLANEGVAFASSCDTETVLHALVRWGTHACAAFRGMYALALWDREHRRLLLARDGLGIKPLYWTQTGGTLAFASEIPALLQHPAISAAPDMTTVSGYISTIRTTLDDRSLYQGIRVLRPGEWLTVSCESTGIRTTSESPPQPAHAPAADQDLRSVITDAVRAHLRSDVPWCSLLSGGIDSTIVATIAKDHAGTLSTYVSGCPDAGDGLADDFGFAENASRAIGTRHTPVPVGRELFLEAWPAMVAALGVPLGTPNEVAIAEVAARLRAEGHAVTLSGEGADELFAGYALPMMTAHDHIDSNPDATPRDDAAAALNSAAWLATSNKGLFLNPEMLTASDGDAALLRWYEQVFEESLTEAGQAGGTGNQTRARAMLIMQRRINLTGLLQRLDSSTMLASVEGRTPYADALVLNASRRIPWDELFTPGDPPGTKLALRNAFRGLVPDAITDRPKRSFPLPFQQWIAAAAPLAHSSSFLRSIYSEEAIAFVCADPAQHWNLAWPMFNLAIWGDSAF